MTDDTRAETPATETAATPGGAAEEKPATADTEEGKAASPETDGDDPAAAGDDEREEPREPRPNRARRRMQDRIDELTRDKYELHRQLEETRTGRKPAAAPPADDAEPKPEDFKSYDDYLVAKAIRKVDADLKAREAQAAADREAEAARARGLKWSQAVEAAHLRYEDIDDILNDRTLPVSPAMADAIKDAGEAGVDVLHWLSGHREDALRIAKLPPLAAARELGKIEATLAKPAPKKTTAAPDPIKPVGGKDAVVRDPDKLSTDEWMRKRNSDLRKAT